MWEKKVPGGCVNVVNGHPIACVSDADCTGNGGGGMCVCSSVHCVNGTFTWTSSGSPYPPNGTAFTDFLYQLNNCDLDMTFTLRGGFAEHCDWRLPTIAELDSIIDFNRMPACYSGIGEQCIDPIFGLTAGDSYYWSATTRQDAPSAAYAAIFGPTLFASELDILKTFGTSVRAVRGGM
jgi:hypothetical protein